MKGRLLGLIAILIWGTHAVSAKYVLQNGGSPWVLAAARLWIAFFAIKLLLRFFKSKTPVPFRYQPSFWIALLIGFLPNILFFHFALKYGFAGATMILENSAPFFALVLGVLFLKNRAGPKTLLSVALAVAGVLLIFITESRVTTGVTMGALYGILAGFTWAIFSMFSERFFRESQSSLPERLDYLSRIMLYGAVLMTPSFFLDHVAFTAKEWLVIFYFAIAPTAIAMFFWNEMVNAVSTLSATIIFTLTIPITLIFAWLTIGEVPTVYHFASAILIIAATVLDAFGKKAN